MLDLVIDLIKVRVCDDFDRWSCCYSIMWIWLDVVDCLCETLTYWWLRGWIYQWLEDQSRSRG